MGNSECRRRLVYLAIPWACRRHHTQHCDGCVANLASLGPNFIVLVEPKWSLWNEPALSQIARHPSGCPGLLSRRSTKPGKETWTAALELGADLGSPGASLHPRCSGVPSARQPSWHKPER